MEIPTMPRPRWLIVVAFAIGIGLTLTAAWAGTQGVVGTMARDLLTVLATSVFTLAIGGGLLGWWQLREWRRRTQWLAVELLSQAMHQTAAIVDRVVLGLPSSADEASTVDVKELFRLPWTPKRDRVLDAYNRLLSVRVQALIDNIDGTGWTSQYSAALEARRDDIGARADRLWDLCQRLTAHMEHDAGSGLLRSAASFHGRVRSYAPPDAVVSTPAVLTGTQVPGVVSASVELTRRLSDAYLELRDRVTEPELRALLDAEVAAAASTDSVNAAEVDEDERLDRMLAEFDQNLAAFSKARDELLAELSEALNSDDEATRTAVATTLSRPPPTPGH